MRGRVAIPLAICLTAVVLLTPGFADAGEDDYILVDRMPDILGQQERSLSMEDEDRRVQLRQEVYSEQFDHAWMQTFVLSASCLDNPAPTPMVPHIVAIKYLPKKPASFAIATLHDIYKEVYVDAQEGRIRLYEDVPGFSMLELSEKYRPKCAQI